MYWYLRYDAGKHLQDTYDDLGVVMNGEGLRIPEELWESVANQYRGYLTGQTLSEECQTNFAKLKDEHDQSTGSGYGCLIPYTRPVKITRDETIYVLGPLTVGRTHVGNPDGLLGGEFNIT